MRIAIVNDSPMAVESLRRVVCSSSENELAWIANDGAEAVWRCTLDTPDLILMDLMMPVMDGVEATRKIMESTPCAIVIVTATVSGNAAKAFQAMGAGALDAVNTPILGMSGDGEGKDELLSKIATIKKLIRQKKSVSTTERVVPNKTMQNSKKNGLVVVGSSSGGPQALAKVLSSLPESFPVPVVIVQHVDQQFTQELAIWLNQQCQLNVRLAQEGDRLVAGQVLIAGTNDHLIMKENCRLTYTPTPKEMAYRPSVDVFFKSVADYWQGNVVAVLLTGMGRDGAEGLLQLRNKGVHTIAQNEATCAVYGMPKAAAQVGAAVEILPIDEIGPALSGIYASSETKGAADSR